VLTTFLYKQNAKAVRIYFFKRWLQIIMQFVNVPTYLIYMPYIVRILQCVQNIVYLPIYNIYNILATVAGFIDIFIRSYMTYDISSLFLLSLIYFLFGNNLIVGMIIVIQ